MKQSDILAELARVIESRRGAEAQSSYVAGLLQGPQSRALKKIGEESVELVMACCEGNHDEMIHEAADLWFHSLVALARHGITAEHILAELERRFGTSGIDEKASRGIS